MASLNQHVTVDARRVTKNKVTMTVYIKHFREMRIRQRLARLLCKLVAWVGGVKIDWVVN